MKYVLIGISINLLVLIFNVIINRYVIDIKLSRIIELLESKEVEDEEDYI